MDRRRRAPFLDVYEIVMGQAGLGIRAGGDGVTLVTKGLCRSPVR